MAVEHQYEMDGLRAYTLGRKSIGGGFYLLKKKWLIAFGVALLCVAFTKMGFAAGQIQLVVNDQEIKTDVPAQLINGRVLVPVRWVAEALGAGVQWAPGKEGYTVKITTKPDTQDSWQRLRAIEPEQPKTIIDDGEREMVKQFMEQNQLHSIQDIRSLGRKVPFEITSQDDTWVRPIYSEAWHSTFIGGKYSNISTLVSYAQRNLFIYSGGLSEGTGLYYRLGFTDDYEKPVSGSSFTVFDSFELWLINHKIKEIFHLDKEWLVVTEPQLQGFQTVRIDYDNTGLKVDEKAELKLMLFRLVTPDGYELERAAGYFPVQ